MAGAVLSEHGFPAGTVVGVWPAQNQVADGAPSGSQVTSATVAADETLTFSGLDTKVSYVAWALDRGVRFSADPGLADELAPSLAPLATRVGAVEELLTSVDSDIAVVKEAPLNVTDNRYGASPSASAAVNDAAFDAAEAALPASGGKILIPRGTFSRSTPLKATKSGVTYIGESRYASIISNSVSDVAAPGVAGANINNFLLEHLKLSAGAGHVIAPLGGLVMSEVHDCQLIQNATNKRVWQQATTAAAAFIDNSIHECEMTVPAGSTVAAFSVVGTGGAANSNSVYRCRLNGGDAEPFFRIEEQTAGTYAYNWTFRDLTFEICRGGLIHGYSAHRWRIENCTNWDMAARGVSVKDGILLSKTTGASSTYNRIVDYMRSNGSLGGSLYDIKFENTKAARNIIEVSDAATLSTFSVNLDSTTGNLLLGLARNISVANAAASTMGFRMGLGTSMDLVPALQLGTNLIAYGSAAPAVGTWSVGDVVWNTGVVAGGSPGWVCTTAGTPGTWKAMANVAT